MNPEPMTSEAGKKASQTLSKNDWGAIQVMITKAIEERFDKQPWFVRQQMPVPPVDFREGSRDSLSLDHKIMNTFSVWDSMACRMKNKSKELAKILLSPFWKRKKALHKFLSTD